MANPPDQSSRLLDFLETVANDSEDIQKRLSLNNGQLEDEMSGVTELNLVPRLTRISKTTPIGERGSVGQLCFAEVQCPAQKTLLTQSTLGHEFRGGVVVDGGNGLHKCATIALDLSEGKQRTRENLYVVLQDSYGTFNRTDALIDISPILPDIPDCPDPEVCPAPEVCPDPPPSVNIIDNGTCP